MSYIPASIQKPFLRANIAVSRYFLDNAPDATFWSFEAGNVVNATKDFDLAGFNFMGGVTTMKGLYEDIASGSFLAGSAIVKLTDKHPLYLTLGMTLMAVGGVGLAASGATFTGLSIAWASLDAARGGYFMFEEQINQGARTDRGLDFKVAKLFEMGTRLIELPNLLINTIDEGLKKLSPDFHNSAEPWIDSWRRPMVRQFYIKAPGRLMYITADALSGNLSGFLGAIAGTLWLGGDTALAHMDSKVKEAAQKRIIRLEDTLKNLNP